MNNDTASGRVWDNEHEYGELLYRRATGELPEMESSQAAAKLLEGEISPRDRVLDVGCGAGHYLRSLRRCIPRPFFYTGVDVTAAYIRLAQQAWKADGQAAFQVADAFSLPFGDRSHDIVMSCNMLLHLPSIRRPLEEMLRVARKCVLVRTMVGERSFRIKEVYSPETHPKSFAGPADGDEFDQDGEPHSFHYYNIYSSTYIAKLLRRSDVLRWVILPDDNYDPAKLLAEKERAGAAPDTTSMIGRWQVNGYILQPWAHILIHKAP